MSLSFFHFLNDRNECLIVTIYLCMVRLQFIRTMTIADGYPPSPNHK